MRVADLKHFIISEHCFRRRNQIPRTPRVRKRKAKLKFGRAYRSTSHSYIQLYNSIMVYSVIYSINTM